MKRRWFQNERGAYYRNCPLVMREREMRINQILPWRARKLRKEWEYIFKHGVRRATRIGWRDEVVKPTSFQDAYPDKPGLWILDEME